MQQLLQATDPEKAIMGLAGTKRNLRLFHTSRKTQHSLSNDANAHKEMPIGVCCQAASFTGRLPSACSVIQYLEEPGTIRL